MQLLQSNMEYCTDLSTSADRPFCLQSEEGMIHSASFHPEVSDAAAPAAAAAVHQRIFVL